MLIRRNSGDLGRARLPAVSGGIAAPLTDRRTFLQRAGLATGALAAVGSLQLGAVRRAEAGPRVAGQPTVVRKNICTHCSVGCTVTAEVQMFYRVNRYPAN